MLDILTSLSAERAVAVAHQSIRILRHMTRVASARRDALVRDVQQALNESDAEAALAVIREIETREGTSLDRLDAAVVNGYVAQLADVAERRTAERFTADESRGRELLRQLRNAS